MVLRNAVIFRKLNIEKNYGKTINEIFYIVDGNKSAVMENFSSLNEDTKKNIKSLIVRMAQNDSFRSSYLKWNIHKYNFGEIRPMPHRFFFFQKCGNNIIFFDYIYKDRDSLDDK
ncbi:MAG TPA: hypothetical protein ENL20_09970, partial [Candidatus Cloacimonetes bacterium]|nr:hypothetical protein [Candidatus Cloacimonadota bacterium]